MTEPAPLFEEIADGPAGGRAFWLETGDGLRIRAGLWRPEDARGSVLIFPGRTEFVEKYGRAAGDFHRRGFASLAVDWRGQGLADRLTGDAMAGHVMRFADYQQDVHALLGAARALDLPEPWHLLGHSMGGCIGLRALIEGMPVASAVFSGPMWGIRMSQALRPVAWSLSWSGRRLGMGHRYAPGTVSDCYVLTEPFETNRLTGDREMYDLMVAQLRAHPELCLGGPSLRWLHEALAETRALSRLPAPRLPCLTVVGEEEDIVDMARIRARMQAWPGGRLEVVPGGRHEVLMEDAATRARLFDLIAGFWQGAAPTQTAS